MRVQTNSKETVLVATVARQRKSPTDQASIKRKLEISCQANLNGSDEITPRDECRALECRGPGHAMAVRLVALGPAVYYDKVLSETGQNLITFLIAWAPLVLSRRGPTPAASCSTHSRFATAHGCHALTRAGRSPRAYLEQNVTDLNLQSRGDVERREQRRHSDRCRPNIGAITAPPSG